MNLSHIDKYLKELLDISKFSDIDRSLNGIQVGWEDAEISHVACAVDASLETFEKAVAQKADMLFVHHGLYWGGLPALTGTTYRRVRFLIEHDLALYACHLPLDAHMEYGNNAGIAHLMGLREVSPFGRVRGKYIGVRGVFPEKIEREEIISRYFPSALRSLSFGKKEVQTVGIISGGAPFEVEQAIKEQLDLYITGDTQHGVYHTCQESSINVIFAGHYETEVFGVKAIGEYLKKEHSIATTFIDVPTGL